MEAFSIKNYDNLFDAVLKLETVDECRKFFEDLCTIKELESLSQRVEVARLLYDGGNYQDISRLTGASTTTISRVSRCLNYGAGGYRLVLDSKGEKTVGETDE